MKFKLVFLATLALWISSCSLADDVTPPPVLATAQAAPVQQGATPVRPASQDAGEETPEIKPPEMSPNIFNGAVIYVDSCEPCHGPSGLGDGSMSANLEVPPPPLGDIEYARAAWPLDWYGVVTEGRIDRFMPPFRSLTDAQRWDVVAYMLSLSEPPETSQLGAELYAETCAACHGDDGQGAENGPPLQTGDLFAERSLNELVALIKEGKGNMPALGENISDDDLLVLAAYTRSLSTVVHADGGMTGAPSSSSESSEMDSSTGVVRGTVINGTSGMEVPDSLEVTVIGLEGNTPVIEQDVPIDREGKFSFEGLEIEPGRIYGAMVEYQDVIYFSVGGHLLEESPILELPLVIYETTPNEDSLRVERLHLIFDFSIEGLVEVSELWLLSTEGDRTVIQSGGVNVLPIQLPSGFGNLRFGNAVALDLYTATEEGFLIHEPIRPGEPLEVVFSFTLPYERSLDFAQPIGLPVQAVVLLTEDDAPDLQGDGVQDLGERDMGGILLRNYAMDSLEAGEKIDLRLRGTHPLASSDLSTSNLAIGLGVFGVVLVVVAIAIWGWQRRAKEDVAGLSEDETPELNREQLLRAIAALDDAQEAGEIEQPVYEQRRAALKSQLMEQMQSDDD